MTRTLAEAAAEAATCTRCRLAEGRTQVVYGVGHPDADLMFIGEGPGFHEDRQGEPFVGAAGQLLTRLLGEIGLARGDVYIANVVKCLRYNTPVLLADGSWERIGRLVRTGYAGSVISVDECGHLVPKRVTGWHATPVGDRRVFRLTYRSSKRSGAGRVSIQLTEDHPVLTERGYVEVRDLLPSDRIATGQGLTDLEFDVVVGSLLGDASIARANSHLSMSHSQRQSGYAKFKAGLLNRLGSIVTEGVVAATAGAERTYPVVHVRTHAHRSLRTIRASFYHDRKCVPSWIADELNPRMLTFWFLDDGHMRIRPPRRPSAEIASVGFDDRDREILLRGLRRLGLPATPSRGRLHFDVDTSERLSTLIAPFVPPSMRYKLHPEAAVRNAYRPELLRHGPQKTLFDRVDVLDVTDAQRTDVTFFCIDVEDTHNFVTAGGVVQNCRPPGNRDPLPDEIEACTPWLVEQVSLIQPCVLVTLGNFATKFVLDTKTGITRMRGQVFPWHGRKVIPTFHPAAILHGGGERSPQFRLLRDDFELVRRILDEYPCPPASDGEDPADSSQLELF